MAAPEPPDPWDLGRPGAPESLWFERTGSSRSAYRSQRLAAVEGGALPLTLEVAPPYEGAQLVTVVLDKDGAHLCVDGAVTRSVDGQRASNTPVTLPLPQAVPAGPNSGFYAPLVFSTLVVGTGVPPAEVTVEYKQADVVLEACACSRRSTPISRPSATCSRTR